VSLFHGFLCSWRPSSMFYKLLIGKYLSRLRKLDHAIVLKVGFEP
jgi:hypothetical protein